MNPWTFHIFQSGDRPSRGERNHEMFAELTLRRIPPEPGNRSPVDAIRILTLLPRHWRKELMSAVGDVVIRVQASGGVTGADVQAVVLAALADPGIGRWELVAGDSSPAGSPPVRSSPSPWRAGPPGSG